MDSSAYLWLSLITLAMCPTQVWSVPSVVGLYGETIEVPCNGGAAPPSELFFTKWKYEKDDGSAGDLLIQQAHKDEATVQARDGYMDRISIAANYSLLIGQGSLSDQRTFTCMVVAGANLYEYPVNVLVYKKPSLPLITEPARQLENGKMTPLGVCIAMDANPAAEITWYKNGQPLVADEKTVAVSSSVKVDPASGLTSTSSSLRYAAVKDDMGARFTCAAAHILGAQASAPQTFTVHYPTENVVLQVSPPGPVREGDNVTLTCTADGNPPPAGFDFHLKGRKVTVEDSDTYTLTAVTRRHAGEYKCSLPGDGKIESSRDIAVSYLDLSLSPSGRVLRTVGGALEVKMETNASGDTQVSWTKDDGRLEKAPAFGRLTYGDAGRYACKATLGGITRRQHFELVVEGKPVITRLARQRSADSSHKVLICEAEGAPQPNVQWSINGTDEQTSYVNGKATHKITVIPTANLTVTCIVTNRLGEDVQAINISSLFRPQEETLPQGSVEDSDSQATLIVGVVIGLFIAAAVIGLIYWIYMKKSRQGSWKTGEESGTSEESKKLEENNHKGDV